MSREFEGKKLLILGGNPETIPLVETAHGMGAKTIVASARTTDPAKKVAWKASDVDGMDVEGLVALAKEENVDGVLVGVADILVPAYCKVCKRLNMPCYATQEIVDVFSFKDTFKETCEKYGVHGIPEFHIDENLSEEDLAKIVYPVMVKPIDNGGGVGMTVCYSEKDLKPAIEKALACSNKKKYLVERYMLCDDVAFYYTFKDDYCSVSCVFDRTTTDEQPGLSRVCLGEVYPSKHLDEYMEKVHPNVVRMFHDIGIRNGVLLLQAFYENGEFYVYDTGFRLQGSAPNTIIKAVQGFDQREMLVRFALSGSEGDMDLREADDVRLRGKHAGTIWFLLKKGQIGKIEGFEEMNADPRLVANIQRLHEGDSIPEEWIGTEKQVLSRAFFVCDTREELAETLDYYMSHVKVTDTDGKNMRLKGYDVNKMVL